MLALLLMALAPFLHSGEGEMLHEFHVAQMAIAVNEEQGTLDITLHTFVDDVELAIGQQGKTGFRLDRNNPRAAGDTTLANYLAERITLEAPGGELLPLKLVGYEAADDPFAIWIYLQAPLPQNHSQLQLRNNLLTELYDDQRAIVRWLVAGEVMEQDLTTRQEPLSILRL